MTLQKKIKGGAVVASAAASLAWGGGALAYDETISFSQAGDVTLTLTGNMGGYDHILELIGSAAPGDVSHPLLVASPVAGEGATEATGASAATYLAGVGYAGSYLLNPVVSISLGSFAAGQALVFRLTNVVTSRIGSCDGETLVCTPSAGGGLASQIFSGIGNAAPNPLYSDGGVLGDEPYVGYTSVTGLGSSTISVGFEDAFAARNSFDNLSFTLSITPAVPEPQTYALMLAGLAAVVFSARRNRGRVAR